MKKLILMIVCLVAVSTQAMAQEVCKWDMALEVGYDCLPVRTVITPAKTTQYATINGIDVSTLAVANSMGYYWVVETPATFTGPDQVIDGEIWSADMSTKVISLTYSVRDKTQAELDRETVEQTADVLYKYMKWQVEEGIANPATAPTEIVNWYLAQGRLNP